MDLQRYLVSVLGPVESESESGMSLRLERESESLCSMFG